MRVARNFNTCYIVHFTWVFNAYFNVCFSPGIRTQKGDARMTTAQQTTTKEEVQEATVRTSVGCLITGVSQGLITTDHSTQTNPLLYWTHVLLRRRNPHLSHSHRWREPLNPNQALISVGTERRDSVFSAIELCKDAPGWDGATDPLLHL